MQHLKQSSRCSCRRRAACATALWGGVAIFGQDDPLVKTEPLAQVIQRTQQEKPTFAKRQQDLLDLRYDLANRPAAGVTMSRGKAVQDGVRVKLAAGMTWEQLAAMTPDEIKAQNAWPEGFYPLPHPHHEAGGMVFPKPLIEEVKKQTAARSDPLRSRLRPARSPDPGNAGAGIFLVTRPDLGDVSKGELVTLDNFERLFKSGPQPEAARRPAAAADAVSAAAVQPDRGSPQREGVPGRGVLRLPCQRPHQLGDAYGRRHPAQRAPAPHRHAVAARRRHPASVRIAARPEERRGLHRVRAARRLLRRRPHARRAQGREPARPRQPGAPHGRVPEPARLPAGAQAEHPRAARPREDQRGRAARRGAVLRQGAVLDLPRAAVLHRQPDAQPAGRALLQGDGSSTAARRRRTARSRPSRCAASRTRRPTSTTIAC